MITSLVIAAVLSGNVPIASRVLQIKDSLYLIKEPEYVAGGIEKAEFSPDGGHLFGLGYRPRIEILAEPTKDTRAVVYIWSAATRKATEALMPTGYAVTELTWEGPNGGLLAALNRGEEPTRFLRIGRDGRTSELRGASELNHSMVATSVKFPGVLSYARRAVAPGQPYQIDSFLYWPPGQTDPTRIPAPPDLVSAFVDEDFRVYMRPRNGRQTVAQFNASNLTFQVLEDFKFQGNQPKEDPFEVVKGEGMAAIVRDRRSAPFESVWAVSDPKAKYPAALIAPKAKDFGMSAPTMNVWFTDDGNLFVRRLQKITQDDVDDLLECEERSKLLSETKQVGTAVMIFMADNDDIFPVANGFREKIFPYIKSNSMLDGFIYSYKGPPEATAVENPSRTELGYKDGNFGRAVVYADSSARWESRRKRPPVGGC